MTRASKRESQLPPQISPPVLIRIIWAVLALTQMLCALLFFTNLTRNPYYTQIVLLNMAIALVGILWGISVWQKGEFQFPRLSYETPLGIFLAVAFVSSVWAWWVHPMLRPGIVFETTRVWVFTLVNCVMALGLPILFTKPVGTDPIRISIWTDIVLALAWGALWIGFHANRDPDPTVLIWDSYGGLVWGLGILYALLRTRRGEAVEFFHVIFAVSFLAGVYGIMQYVGKDIIWTSLVVPYGGRPVSSFGNPNFLSSYVMMVCPLALGFGLRVNGKDRYGYFLISLVCAVAVLCTLTRSSYLGLLAAMMAMMFFLVSINPGPILKSIGISILGFLLLVLVFPKTPISNLQSPLLRFTEIFDAVKSGQVYGPWHQRVLIWSSAWDMLLQNRLLGKGWGCFELFYPFFQGKYLSAPTIGIFRTHANNAHNILMELWAQTGFLGAGAALWLFVVMVVSGWNVVRQEQEGPGRYVPAALLAGMIGMVVDNFFGNVSIFFATPAFLFWWNAGALENENKRKNVEVHPLSGALGRPLLILFMAFCLGVLIYFTKRWEQEVFYFEGFRISKMGDVQKSIKPLEKAYEWFPGEVNSNYELGNSYASYARVLAEKGLPDEAANYRKKAEDGFKAALYANPGYDEIYFNLGVVQAQNGEREEGVGNLEISLFINPLLREAYGALGNLYLQMGNISSAAHTFEQSVGAFPDDKDLWNNLGYCYSQLKDSKKSFESYKRAVQIDPSFNQGWQNLGLAARTMGETRDPILQVPALIQQMEQFIAQKNYQAALAPAEKVAAILPDSADAHLSLGNLCFYTRQSERGEKEFKRAIELRPSFVIAYVNLGRLYQMDGKLDQARIMFNKALDIDSGSKDAKDALNSLPK